MKIQLAEGQLWIFPDDKYPRPANAMAGPFRNRVAAAWWIVERLEEGLKPDQVQQWGQALQLAGGTDANPFHLIGLLTLIRHRAAPRLIERSSPAVREASGHIWREIAPDYPVEAPRKPAPVVDRKMASVGDV